MNIAVKNNVNFTSMAPLGQRIYNGASKLYRKIPNITINNPALFNRLSDLATKAASPAVNRLILGVAALLIQPMIDYHNHKVDQETRKVSACRTAAKIIAGTSVGMIVREFCYRVSKNPKLLPPGLNLPPDKIANYQIALATFMALGMMVFTNFLLDAPLTTYLSNKFTDKVNKKEASK